MRTGGIGALALLLLVAGVAQAQGPSAEVGVMGVIIQRGPGSGALPKLEAPEPASALAGSRLWIVHESDGTVISCRNVATANVGERRIRCTRGRLPPD